MTESTAAVPNLYAGLDDYLGRLKAQKNARMNVDQLFGGGASSGSTKSAKSDTKVVKVTQVATSTQKWDIFKYVMIGLFVVAGISVVLYFMFNTDTGKTFTNSVQKHVPLGDRKPKPKPSQHHKQSVTPGSGRSVPPPPPPPIPRTVVHPYGPPPPQPTQLHQQQPPQPPQPVSAHSYHQPSGSQPQQAPAQPAQPAQQAPPQPAPAQQTTAQQTTTQAVPLPPPQPAMKVPTTPTIEFEPRQEDKPKPKPKSNIGGIGGLPTAL